MRQYNQSCLREGDPQGASLLLPVKVSASVPQVEVLEQMFEEGLGALLGPCEGCLLRGMLHNFPEGLIVTDREGRVMLVSREAELLLGLVEAEALGKPLTECLDSPSFLRFWARVSNSHQLQRFSLVCGVPPRRVRVSCAPFLSGLAGKQGFFLLFARATSARKGYQELQQVFEHYPDLEVGPGEDLLAPLSAQERRVFALLIEGKTNAAIGAALHISKNTVGTHVRRIYRKLGIKSRVEALRLVTQVGDKNHADR